MKAIIVGSGPSAMGFQSPEGVLVIGVNGTAEWLERMDYWFTLDPSPKNLYRMSRPRPGIKYVAAIPHDVQLPRHVQRLVRVSEQGPEPDEYGTPAWYLWRWGCILGLCTEPGRIHTGNSVYGALGFAYHLGVTEVLLVGVDATQEARVEGGRPNNLSHLPVLFQSVTEQIRVLSVSPGLGLPVTTVAEFINALPA